jgi:hypothetical protein
MTSPSMRTRSLRREPLRYWKRAEPRDLVSRLGNLRRQRSWRMRVKPTFFAVVKVEPLFRLGTQEIAAP